MGGSGIRSTAGGVVGLCSRWDTESVLQKACGAMGLVDCTVKTWGFYTDPVSPESLFHFFTGSLADSCHPLTHDRGRERILVTHENTPIEHHGHLRVF
jgi:hypothetical protein